MPDAGNGEYRVNDAELRDWVERLADELCLTVKGNFDHLVRLDVTDDTLEKLQMLVNFVLDNARRATEARREADRLARENVNLLDEVGRAREMGSYQLEELLGRGGMGEVWRGRHRMLARPAAIKLIKRQALAAEDSRAADRMLVRFQREAQATAVLRSPHTIEVYDFGVHEGNFYYVMELLDGVDLSTLVETEGPQPPERVAFLLRQACHSLSEAHSQGMTHRDVKPSNLFVCRHGTDLDFVKVLDFGLVKIRQESNDVQLTQEGSVSGTPAFSSPEQILGQQDTDHRADLYALGCTAYWLLAGHLVFEADTPMAMMLRHLNDEPTPLSRVVPSPLPDHLEVVVMRCLEKNPADRPQSAEELANCLEEIGIIQQWTPDRRKQRWLQWEGVPLKSQQELGDNLANTADIAKNPTR